ncbi:Tannase/feruloyl esterase [Apiospora hydei]|uniref:Carboxylic ester hydrolase n=1 Tax=Apiospora hydei TaxID=1337664 RepID=A0ABR1VWM2_9PEZI
MDQLASFLGFDSVTMGPVGLSSCTEASIPYPTSLPTAQFLSVEAHVVTNYTVTIPPGFENSFAAPYAPLPILNFCNVTLTYTHPGLGDKIKTQVWLPLGDLDSVGNGEGHQPPPKQNTGSISRPPPPPGTAASKPSVAAASPQASSPNPAPRPRRRLRRRHDGRRALRRRRPGRRRYAYFTGCSTGGRQAAVLAQRWPGDYDGYLAGAASVRCQDVTAALGPQARVLELGYAPPACEMRELRRLVIQKCDGHDGVEDGLVSEPEQCFEAFDPRVHVGEEFVCEETGHKLKITKEAVEVAMMAWEGLREDDGVVWGGVGHQADLAGSRFSWAATTCDYNNSDGATHPQCKPKPWSFATAWVQYFLLQDPATPSDPTAFFKSGLPDIERLVYMGRQWYTSILSAFDTDLSALRDGGGKLLMWHGMADEAVPLNNSRAYYDAVAARDPEHVDEYLRYFEAPGLAHCGIGGDGNGLFPVRLLDVLRAWVEEGKAPESVAAMSKAADPETGVRMKRELCRYPRKSTYDGVGDVASAASFRCV